MSVTYTLGKDVSISGVNNARSFTVSQSVTEIDVTKFGDTERKIKKGVVEQTVEVECVDAHGVTLGGTFALTGTDIGNATYVVTSIKEDNPIDGIKTFTVSGARCQQPSS
jgi:hypothetical protein|tara:strand:- start:589 stop:918 length:330 start_codon:yes stop_codon:yes gene_type:complete